MIRFMKTLDNLLQELQLIYYEYDARLGMLVVDKKSNKSDFGMELVSITHWLQKNRLPYSVDKNSNIIVQGKNSKIRSIINILKRIKNALLYKRMPIYILSDKKVKGARNLPLFTTRALRVDVDIMQYDALVFTSKNGVHTINSIDKRWQKKPSYVIGPQTAKMVKRLGGRIGFVGKTRHGDTFAKEIVPFVAGKKVLYLSAKEVVSNMADTLDAHDITFTHLPIYETVCVDTSKEVLPKHAYIIFSSPSSITCFLKHYRWDESFTAIAIGDTTAKYFPSHIVPVIADTTSLESCVSKALALQKRYQ